MLRSKLHNEAAARQAAGEGRQQFSLWDEWDEWDEWRMLIRGMEHPKEWTPNLPDQPK